MKTITIRDLRQRWPETEKALQVEHELIITRDGKPVAKLLRVVPEKPTRKRWHPEDHKKWLKKIWGSKMFAPADESIARARADRLEPE